MSAANSYSNPCIKSFSSPALKSVKKKLKKSDYNEIIENDRSKLLACQFKIRDLKKQIMIVISGPEGTGKSEVVNLLNEWMDTRYISTHVHRPFGNDEKGRPYFWRYWQWMPAKGEIGLFIGSWYTEPLHKVISGQKKAEVYKDRLEMIRRQEKLLTDDEILLIKIRLEISPEKQKKRIKKFKLKPDAAWRLAEGTLYGDDKSGRSDELITDMLEKTAAENAPWFLVDANYKRNRDVSVMHLLTQEFDRHIKRVTSKIQPDISKITYPEPSGLKLEHTDLSKVTEHSEYKKMLAPLQKKIYKQTWKNWDDKKGSIFLFEGWDAAGKGGAIRRLIHGLDARLYRAVQIGAPTQLEHAHHYLWRFWQEIPEAGFITIYDRSWYGRILVERVEGFAREDEWKRAYMEICDFEQQLVDAGFNLIKFWLHVSKEEQYRRFKEREHVEFKKYKLTDEDWRNREKWDRYEDAINDMLNYTHTDACPWHVIPAEDKKTARIEVLKSIISGISD